MHPFVERNKNPIFMSRDSDVILIPDADSLFSAIKKEKLYCLYVFRVVYILLANIDHI